MAPPDPDRPLSRIPTAAEVVAIGDELLLGDIVDGNGAWLGRVLADLGLPVVRRSVVGDVDDDILAAVSEALDRTGCVLCSGGLGPTHDDRTKPVVARLFDRHLVMDEAWLATVTAWFQQRGREIPLSSRDQALVPEGATVFPNAWGTAPGLALEDARGIVVLLPGVPHELQGLVTEQVLPFLRSRAAARLRRVRSRRIRTVGIAESALGEQIRDLVEHVRPLTVAFLPSAAGVDVRFTATGLSDDDADQRLADACAQARERLGPAIYATDDDDLAAALGRDLAAKGLRLAVAESCTGGLIAKRLSDAPGASAFLVEGFVTYSNEAKQRTLGVPADTIEQHGAVSEQVVRAMVGGALRITGADCAVAITGIAGPGGGSAEKPVGTVWIAAAYGDRVVAGLHRFRGDRTEIRERSAQVALLTLRKLLTEG